VHHGGSLWIMDNSGWFMVQNEAEIERSAQFSFPGIYGRQRFCDRGQLPWPSCRLSGSSR
jgi:hypothetical protein